MTVEEEPGGQVMQGSMVRRESCYKSTGIL